MSSKPKVGVSLYSYGWDIKMKKMTIKECIEHAASLNIGGVEIVDKHHIPNYPHPSVYDLQQFREYIESFGMKVICYSTYIDNMLRTDRMTTFEEEAKQILDDIAEAKILGTKILRPAYRIREQTIGEAEDCFEKTFKYILPTLKKYDVEWGIEIHAPTPPQTLLDLVKTINNNYLRLVPDFSAWQTKGLTKELTAFARMSNLNLLKDCMPYVNHVHAKAHVFNEKGEEPNTPYDKLISIIKESNFSGYIAAEFEGWMVKEVKSKEIVKTHVDLIRKYL